MISLNAISTSVLNATFSIDCNFQSIFKLIENWETDTEFPYTTHPTYLQNPQFSTFGTRVQYCHELINLNGHIIIIHSPEFTLIFTIFIWLYFYSTPLIYLFLSGPHCFNYYNFNDTSDFVLVFQYSLGYSVSCASHINFRNSVLTPIK